MHFGSRLSLFWLFFPIPAVVVAYFVPFDLVFLKTIIAGGDTPSHYQTAFFLKDVLLPELKISGWSHGNFCGYPVLQHYFPLPFLMIVFLSHLIPLEIAFKIVFVLPLFLFPYTVYFFCVRIISNKYLAMMCSVASLSFLFNDGNVMWGGNVYSLLAGEFCCSFSFCFMLIYLRELHKAVTETQNPKSPAIFLALTGLSHFYPFIFAVISSSFYLLQPKNALKNLKLLLYIGIISFFLMGFWIIPLLANLELVTPLRHQWYFGGINDFFTQFSPKILTPFLISAIVAFLIIIIKRPQKIQLYLPYYHALIGFLLYLNAYRLWQSDVRFLPFAQLSLSISPIIALSAIGAIKKIEKPLCTVGLALIILWVVQWSQNIHDWMSYSLKGMEHKPRYEDFTKVMQKLKGELYNPRIVYEHNPINELVGTVRAFELIPMFTNRGTLEGLYMQPSPSGPYVFYIQSLLTKSPSCPFPEYSYARMDLKRAFKYLQLFNVDTIVSVSDELKLKLFYSQHFIHLEEVGIFDIYKLRTSQEGYVTPLPYYPAVYGGENWREVFFDWFRLGDQDIPIVYCRGKCEELNNWPKFIPGEKIPKIPIDADQSLKVSVENEKIIISNAHIGKPLLVKVSYHKGWKVKGAERIYFCSPCFMLVVPKDKDVELYYQRGFEFFVGLLMTFIAIFYLLFTKIKEPSIKTKSSFFIVSIVIAALVTFSVMGTIFYFEAPEVAIRKVLNLMDQRDHSGALRVIAKYDKLRHSIVLPQLLYYKGLCLERLEKPDEAISSFHELYRRFPDTDMAAYALFHLGQLMERKGNLEEAIDFYTLGYENYQDLGCFQSLKRLRGGNQ